jgi:hypothetical protein
VAKEAGLTVSRISTPDKRYIVESMSGGTGLIDCDNDGKLDIITVNGSTIDRYRQGGDPMITLYHQDANFKFSEITSTAGLTHKGWGMGVAVADFDNDGWPDIYVTGFGGNALYRNLGHCKFEDVTSERGRCAAECRRAADAAAEPGRKQESPRFVPADRHQEQPLSHRRAGDGEGREAGTVQRSPGRGQLHFTERPALALWPRAEARMNEVEIRWPSGKLEVLRDLPADFIYTIVEGQGMENKVALPPP